MFHVGYINPLVDDNLNGIPRVPPSEFTDNMAKRVEGGFGVPRRWMGAGPIVSSPNAFSRLFCRRTV